MTEKTEKEKMLTGEWYWPGDETLSQDRKDCQKKLKEFNESIDDKLSVREEIGRKMFGSYGKNILINPTLRCDYGYNLYFGNNVEINYDCVFLDIGKITFGDNVFMGPGVHIYSVNHPIDAAHRKTGAEIGKDVTIGKNAWICGACVICPGVTIGENAVIAAGSVVVKNIPANAVAAGNPAQVKRMIDPKDEDQLHSGKS